MGQTWLSKGFADLSMTIRGPPSPAQPLASRAGVFCNRIFKEFTQHKNHFCWALRRKQRAEVPPEKGRGRSDTGVQFQLLISVFSL